MTQSKLGRAADIPASTIGSLEGGFYRMNVDLLHRIINALGVEITSVWPGGNHTLERTTAFFRLKELHLLTAAEASCLILNDKREPHSSQRILFSIGSVDPAELENSSSDVWTRFVKSGRAKQISVCLKHPNIEGWMIALIERYLPLWLATVEI
jgi:DNA-binding XRE family transcriptional regulator